jgi:hypothetical protein
MVQWLRHLPLPTFAAGFGRRARVYDDDRPSGRLRDAPRDDRALRDLVDQVVGFDRPMMSNCAGLRG